MAGRASSLLCCFLPLAFAVHYPDNGDGTFSNPVMPNAHWSDPAVVRSGGDYFLASSSIETSPGIQILHSTDLVNWDVISSVFRFWPVRDPVTNRSLAPCCCWSPRLMVINGRFRVMWHSDATFLIAEAAAAAGPWALVLHNLTYMNSPPPDAPPAAALGPQWAATTYEANGHTYIFAANWIQESDAAALNWVDTKRTYVADMRTPGVGLMENPSLMRRGEYFYWHTSSNGTVTPGLSPDPNDLGPAANVTSSNKGALSVWRATSILGPYEGPRHVLLSNTDFTCVNTGTVVLGPDNATWWYLYNAIEASRWSLQRQLMLDRVDFDDKDWPVTRTPSATRRFPSKATVSQRAGWRPDPSDDFEGPGLEGITSGILGRKWLFKQEDPALWSLQRSPGWLSLSASGVGIDSTRPANLLLQRPTSSYFTLQTQMRFTAACGAGSHFHAGLIARELNTGSGVACGVRCNATGGGAQLAVWQDNLNLVWASPFVLTTPVVHLRLDLDLVKAQAWWSPDGSPGSWSAFMGSGFGEGGFTYSTTRLTWNFVHAGPGEQQFPSQGTPIGHATSEGGGLTTANEWYYADSFTTQHPGLFAGGGGANDVAEFNYFDYTDNERFAETLLD